MPADFDAQHLRPPRQFGDELQHSRFVLPQRDLDGRTGDLKAQRIAHAEFRFNTSRHLTERDRDLVNARRQELEGVQVATCDLPALIHDEDVVAEFLGLMEDLRRERDVRRAIVACYARMERALAGSGRGRRAHETPLEFLRRVLERVGREPGLVLTELFERARFSVEPMGESEKRSAIATLEQLRGRVTR